MNDADRQALARSMNAQPKRQVESLLTDAPEKVWAERDGYAAVDARSGGRCECRGLTAPGCGLPAVVHHHVAGRVGEDPHDPDGVLHLAVVCHLRIHANPEQSYANGTMRSRLAVKP